MYNYSAMMIGVAAGLALLAPLPSHAVQVVDVAAKAGLPSPLPSNGESVVFDYDADGDMDIIPSSHGQEWPFLLVQSLDGTFKQILKGTFATGQDRHGCTSADFNAYGRLDVFCTRGACKGICKSPYPKELYLQRPDRTFALIPGAWGASDIHGRGRDVLALDFDKDGRKDLITGNETSTAFPTVGNHLFRNQNNGAFQEVTPTPLAHTMGTFRVTAIPKPNGFPDVAMRTTNGVFYYPNKNVSGSAAGFQAGRKLGGTSSWDVEAADLNGDGLDDLVIVRQASLEIRLNNPKAPFAFDVISYKSTLTQGRDVALCQLDGKPGIDIYVVQGVRPANQDFVLLNKGDGKSYQRLATPTVAKGHGDVGTCVPGYPGRSVMPCSSPTTSGSARAIPDWGPRG